jgi:hypothetical protein
MNKNLNGFLPPVVDENIVYMYIENNGISGENKSLFFAK